MKDTRTEVCHLTLINRSLTLMKSMKFKRIPLYLNIKITYSIQTIIQSYYLIVESI